MSDKDLIRFALEFRKGILNGEKSRGWCRVISEPLGSLLESQGVKSALRQCFIDSYFQHFYLELEDGRILDPTADQFRTPTGKKMPKVFLGEIPPWYC